MRNSSCIAPDWDRLFETALGQHGLFTTRQALEAGYSAPLIYHHLHKRRFQRVLRGVYRIVHFPAGDREDLVALWLWTDRLGVFSHQTALSLHELSDVLPSRIHITLPASWQRRRLRVPEGAVLHFADLEAKERSWYSAVPTTNPRRSLIDCARSLSPDLLQQAARQALRRGLVTRPEIAAVESALSAFGGIAV